VAKVGRPSEYNEKIARKICEYIVNGVSLRTICKKPGFPVLSTIFCWLEKHKEFAEQYARARNLQAEIYADEIVELSDTPLIGKKTVKGTREGLRGGKRKIDEVTVGDNVERSKLRVDARKWVAVKLLRRKYGDEKDEGVQKNRLNELEDVFRQGPVKTGTE
jgi:hypothetical protein